MATKRTLAPRKPRKKPAQPVDGWPTGFRIDSSILLECIDSARESLLLAAESIGADDRGNEIDVADLRREVFSALGALVTAKREANAITRQAAEVGK